MKSKQWNFLVLAVTVLTVFAYLFLFKSGKLDPTLASIPFVFWSGFVVTVLVVIATFLGSKFFPYKDPKKQ
ncbi:hypothetical protein PBT90_04035 [Algoriphagus halophytocola]|uniref:DUF1049 domain-containing protein n=1 Tax=Algoriphagus halophytocola TaxID=2991499 RepID=A0ABY6MHA9_9BACT|nr:MULTISPECIES: hypothetical protein [unclassified Algoriphagus]UZD22588.1 hypothetical protein OM944_18295 [Algoriphagus sp. TR-M5]WBL43854.1 hypothetical protein PBT90_04035 [Algoriphagus sp. TR-M9]